MTDIIKLRRDRDAAAARGDHGEALVLNDKVLAARDQIECPSCRARRDKCRLCGGTGVVTEQQYRDWPEAG